MSKFQDVDLLKTYVSKIQELEGELLHLRRTNTSKRNELIDYLDLDDNALHPKSGLFLESDSKSAEVTGKLLFTKVKVKVKVGLLVFSTLSPNVSCV